MMSTRTDLVLATMLRLSRGRAPLARPSCNAKLVPPMLQLRSTNDRLHDPPPTARRKLWAVLEQSTGGERELVPNEALLKRIGIANFVSTVYAVP